MSTLFDIFGEGSHEVLDNTVKFRTLVTETELVSILVLASCKSAEVLDSFWNTL